MKYLLICSLLVASATYYGMQGSSNNLISFVDLTPQDSKTVTGDTMVREHKEKNLLADMSLLFIEDYIKKTDDDAQASFVLQQTERKNSEVNTMSIPKRVPLLVAAHISWHNRFAHK